MPATTIRNLVLVRRFQIHLVGGSEALADFHVTPPLGSNIASHGAMGSPRPNSGWERERALFSDDGMGGRGSRDEGADTGIGR